MNKLQLTSMIEKFNSRGIRLWTENGKLKYKAAQGVLNNKDIQLLKENKADIITCLENENVTIIIDKENENEPFALTEIQQAYMLGRSTAFRYGGVSCHIYMELKYSELDGKKVEKIWNQLIDRHPMLRSKISKEGYQCVMKKNPGFVVKMNDFASLSKEERELRREAIKKALDHKMYDTSSWPLYTVTVSNMGEYALMHFSMEFLVADWLSIWTVLSEFEYLYFNEEKQLPQINVTYRDYLLAEQKMKKGVKAYRDKMYWLSRIQNMPLAPELPVSSKTERQLPRFVRRQMLLDSQKWQNFKKCAAASGVTPTSAVITAYSMCLAKWSTNKEFCINLSILNRLPLHPQVNNIVGDFTASSLLTVDARIGRTFEDMAKKTNSQLFEDLDHRLFNGVQVLRELQKIHGNNTIMPYVFTSAIGLLTNEQSCLKGKMMNTGISQTPQVFMDCQVMDTIEGLNINIDSREGIFREGVLDDFKDTFYNLLCLLSEDGKVWKEEIRIPIPQWQKDERNAVNATKIERKYHLLQEKVVLSAKENPERVCVIDFEEEWNGRTFLRYVQGVRKALLENNVRPGDIVAIELPKSRWQIAAAIGILETGAIYVPLNIKQAKKRNEKILTKTKAKVIICIGNSELESERVSRIDIRNIYMVDELEDYSVPRKPEDLAYIIFTSGSTGEPKGVAISHKAAVNTIEDINERYHITENDRVMQLSQMNFDLSVYDLFGVIAEGGAVVIPDMEQYKNPVHWVDMMLRHKVTVWNSVPAFMQMLMIYLQFNTRVKLSLRLVMMSGDWIPTDLPDKLLDMYQGIQVVSLGGATEGGIWSIYHNCVKGEMNTNGFASIPYGRPLTNQGYMVLDSEYEECPTYVEGDLLITGDSLADGYFGDDELTKKAFVMLNGKRCYLTGDRGFYHRGGEIEFTGRSDQQVKIRGHRIELGEVESVYKQCFKVQDIVCVMCEKAGEKILVSAYVTNSEGKDVLANKEKILNEWLPSYMIPSYDVKLESIPLTTNGKIDNKEVKRILEAHINEEQIGTKIPVVTTELEKKLCDLFTNVLGIEKISVDEDFYTAGANSLTLARAAGGLNQEIDSSIAYEEYLVQILNEPNIASLARFIDKKKRAEEENNIKPNKVTKAVTYFKKQGTSNTYIVYGDISNEEMLAYLSDKDRIVVEKDIDVEDIVAILKSERQIYIIAQDSNIHQSINLAVTLLEGDYEIGKLVLIEGDEEIELDKVTAFMGDINYILTASDIEEGEEIKQALSDICYGEINLIDGKGGNYIDQAFKG